MGVIKIEYIITDHAKERYAMRIANRDNTFDVKRYVACNDEKIISDINKMMEYADFIAEGKFGKNSQEVRVFICDTWAILVDKEQPKIITFYKIDLSLGEEFNKDYIKRAREKIAKAQEEYNKSVKTTEEECAGYYESIDSMNEEIAELQNGIKNMQKLISDFKDTIRDSHAKTFVAEKALRDAVSDLITRKTW